MLKEKDLMNVGQTRFRNGDGVTLESIEKLLAENADKYQIPVAFGRDQIKSGGVLSKNIVDCLILRNPEHVKDYNYYLFSITRQGTYAFVSVWVGGNSKIGAAEFAKKNIFDLKNRSAFDQGAIVGSLIRGVVGGGLFASKNKKEAEINWYTMINDIIREDLGLEAN